ncbi:MAG: hypothetical protein GXO63_01870 [Candidatus Micrarchaeota archaeon]|nr:hypothetical protein [Candidatus Micrarchaeota archaeon]
MTGIEALIVGLRESGFPLILLWMLALSIVYGVLSHVGIPKQASVRGVISLVTAFFVLLSVAATPVTGFIMNLVTAFIMIAFGLLLILIFLEMTGTKVGDKHIFAEHPRFFGGLILLVGLGIFIGAGGLNLLGWRLSLSETALGIIFFLVIMIIAVWVLMNESGGKE